MSNDKAQELTAKISDSITALCAETDAAKQSTTYTAWLSTMSRFHRYSFGNCLLIWAQCPEASNVAGFHAWRALDRFVMKGQTGLRIFAPIVRKVEEIKDGKTEVATRPVGFRTVSVFDVSQTDGKPLPTLECNAVEGGDCLLPRMEQATNALGIRLEYKHIVGGADGLSKGGLIEIEQALSVSSRCGVLAHELAHELMHKENRESTKQQRELEAESVAFAVLAHFGMRLESRFYLASYGITAEMLTASLQVISKTAKRIIELIGNEQTDQKGGAEEDGPFSLPLAA